MFDLRLPASDCIENGNGLEGGFGLGNNTVSCFGKGGVFSLANGAGTSGSERNLVSDLNEPAEEITGLDFLGVNRDPVWHRRVDEGSSLGLFSGNRKIANEEWSFEKEKGTHFPTLYKCTGSISIQGFYYYISNFVICSFFTVLVL